MSTKTLHVPTASMIPPGYRVDHRLGGEETESTLYALHLAPSFPTAAEAKAAGYAPAYGIDALDDPAAGGLISVHLTDVVRDPLTGALGKSVWMAPPDGSELEVDLTLDALDGSITIEVERPDLWWDQITARWDRSHGDAGTLHATWNHDCVVMGTGAWGCRDLPSAIEILRVALWQISADGYPAPGWTSIEQPGVLTDALVFDVDSTDNF